MKKDHPGIPTFTGKLINPFDIAPEDIDIRDIAHHLSLTCRYSGATPSMYSVAQHSVYVATIVHERHRLAALLHDAPEYIMGDLSHPIKHGMHTVGPAFRALEAYVEHKIEEAFGLERGSLDDPFVKDADEKVFQVEWSYFVEKHPEAYDMLLWTSEQAEDTFLSVFRAATLARS